MSRTEEWLAGYAAGSDAERLRAQAAETKAERLREALIVLRKRALAMRSAIDGARDILLELAG